MIKSKNAVLLYSVVHFCFVLLLAIAYIKHQKKKRKKSETRILRKQKEIVIVKKKKKVLH